MIFRYTVIQKVLKNNSVYKQLRWMLSILPPCSRYGSGSKYSIGIHELPHWYFCSTSIYLNSHLPSGPVHPYQLGCLVFLFIFILFWIAIMLANSEDPDQTPRSAASDLDLHCLPMSHKWNVRLICVEMKLYLFQDNMTCRYICLHDT